MTKTAIVSDKPPPAPGPFSAAVRAGAFIYLSGQVGVDPATDSLVEGGVVAEAEQLFANLAVVLEAAGKGFDDVIRAGVFLVDMADYAALNAVYARHFTQPYPARTCVAVAALPLGARVEIDLVVRA